MEMEKWLCEEPSLHLMTYFETPSKMTRLKPSGVDIVEGRKNASDGLVSLASPAFLSSVFTCKSESCYIMTGFFQH